MTKKNTIGARRKSRQRGITTKDRELKLKFFYEWDLGIGPTRIKCNHQFPFRSRRAMADELGLDDSQLEGSKDGNDRLSMAALTALGNYLGFDPNWPEWSHGTAWDFAERYNRENAHKPKARGTVAQTSEPPKPSLLKRGPYHKPRRSKIKGMASVEIDGQQLGYGTADIETIISCGMPMLGGSNITIKSAQIKIDGGDARLTSHSHRKWLSEGRRNERGSNGGVDVIFGGGDRTNPIWRLEADGASIGNLILEAGFVAFEGLAPGGNVCVELGTWLMDIQDMGADGAAPTAGLSDGVALVKSDGTELPLPAQTLSALKRHVISCIRKRHVSEKDGYVNLASHALEVAKAVQDD